MARERGALLVKLGVVLIFAIWIAWIVHVAMFDMALVSARPQHPDVAAGFVIRHGGKDVNWTEKVAFISLHNLRSLEAQIAAFLLIAAAYGLYLFLVPGAFRWVSSWIGGRFSS